MSERQAGTYRKGAFTETHVLLMDRLNREGIDYLGEQIYNRGEYNEDGKMLVWIADILITHLDYRKQLVIEIDGESHNSRHRIKLDADKGAWFANRGMKVLRFSNSQVKHHIEDVIRVIRLEMARA